MSARLEVDGLSIAYRRRGDAPKVVVHDVELALHGGSILGVAGESGCGKSTLALATVGYRAREAEVLSGETRLDGVDLLAQKTRDLRLIWGRRVAYVAQDAAGSLNPLKRIGWLLDEPLRGHLGLSRKEAHARALELLERVGLRGGEQALRRFPHEFSGGQQQRIALAIAMSCRPEVLVLDEPTTGLDVTTQAQISRLIIELVRQSRVSALYISHDIALLATVCDEIVIMYAGEVMERALAAELFHAPRHPYAAALLDAVPTIADPTPTVGIAGRPPAAVVTDACPFQPRCRLAVDACRTTHPSLESVIPGHDVRCLRAAEIGPVPSARPTDATAAARQAGQAELEVSGLRCVYRSGRNSVVAVDDVSIAVAAGETLGVVGESGSGKSTLLQAIAGLRMPSGGSITFEGRPLAPLAASRPRDVLRAIQIVFQHPDSSLNPRHRVASLIERPLQLFQPNLSRQQRHERVLALLEDVHLDAEVASSFPHQLSGGQKQRVALARAFAADPRLILCDEVVSALDVSVQASILELLAKLAAERGTALIFVTHDLAVVRAVADRISVMESGRICETGTAAEIFERPTQAYTRELLAAVPDPAQAADDVAARGGVAASSS
jgi:peptide/nickel transport system ATP-binding protein